MSRFNHKLVTLYFTITVSLVSVFAILGGCSLDDSLDGKFEESHHINLAPFSENVTAMAGELQYGFDQVRGLRTKWYVEANSIKLKRLLNLEKLITNEIRFIVKYSASIVFLSESNIPIDEKNKQLARFVSDMYKRFSNSKTLSIPNQQKNEIITNIKKQKKFLSALRATQPFINELARYANRLLDQLKKAEKDLAFHISDKIDANNNHLKILIKTLKKNEIEISNAIINLNNYEQGDKSAFVKLKKSNILLKKSLIKDTKSLTTNQISLLRKHLLTKLTENTNFFKQIKPSFIYYLKTQEELVKLVKDHDSEIRKTRLVFITFASAHRKMASGVVRAAEWFDIRDTPKLLLKFLPL